MLLRVHQVHRGQMHTWGLAQRSPLGPSSESKIWCLSGISYLWSLCLACARYREEEGIVSSWSHCLGSSRAEGGYDNGQMQEADWTETGKLGGGQIRAVFFYIHPRVRL